MVTVKNPPADIQFRVIAPGGAELVPAVVRMPNDEFKITFTPTVSGEHRVVCLAAGQTTQVADFNAQPKASPSPPSQPVSGDTPTVSVHQEVSFVVTVKNAPPDIQFFVVDPSGGRQAPRVAALPDDQFKISFCPVVPGAHTVECVMRGQATRLVTVQAERREGAATTLVVGQLATFYWDVLSGDAATQIVVYDPNGRAIPTQLQNVGPNKFKFSFTPTIPGEYSPQTTGGIKMTPVTAVLAPAASGSHQGRVEVVGQPATFIITVQNTIEIPQFRVLDPTKKIAIHRTIEKLGADQVKITFTPTTPGEYEIQTTTGTRVALIQAVAP